jgi:hypothetical protein
MSKMLQHIRLVHHNVRVFWEGSGEHFFTQKRVPRKTSKKLLSYACDQQSERFRQFADGAHNVAVDSSQSRLGEPPEAG